MGLYILSYQCRSSRRLLLVQMLGALVYASHFALLGAYSGAISQLITMCNCALLGFGADDPRAWSAWRGWKWLVAACYVIFTLMTMHSAADLLPCVGSVATTFAAWTRVGRDIRLAKLFVSGPCWAVYDILNHSISGVLTQLIGMLSVLISILRYGWKALGEKN